MCIRDSSWSCFLTMVRLRAIRTRPASKSTSDQRRAQSSPRRAPVRAAKAIAVAKVALLRCRNRWDLGPQLWWGGPFGWRCLDPSPFDALIQRSTENGVEMMDGRLGEPVSEPRPVLPVETVWTQAVESDVAEGGPDPGVDPTAVLVNRLRSACRLDLNEPFVEERTNGRPGHIDLSCFCVSYEGPKRTLGGRGVPDEGLGQLSRSAVDRICPSKGSELPTTRSSRALAHRACTIGTSCSHGCTVPELGQKTRTRRE